MKIFWTDGSAFPNPGMGGYAVIDQETEQPVALGRELKSTNIRMEGWALVAAIKLAGNSHCEIHTDSEFWINVLTKWAATWQKNGWKKSSPRNREIQNLELVQTLYKLYQEHDIELIWERGHIGTKLNELADVWANRARRGEGFGTVKPIQIG